MKSFISKAILLTIICSLITTWGYSQKNTWRWQNPLPQGNTLRGSAALTKNVIVMVGDAGTIIKSKDGGENWTRQKTNLREDLYAVSFIDSINGMAVGENGIIIKTNDCGKTWEKLTSGRNDTLRGISMLNKDIIIAVGDTGTILKSTNAGQDWVYDPLPGFKPNLNGVFFPTPDFGVIVGDSFPPFGGPPIIMSEDSGISFSPLGPGNSSLSNVSLNNVWIPKADPNKAVAVGNEGTIVSTTTKGQTFSTPITNVTVPIKDVWFFNDKNGFATGPNGTLLRTKDCGDTWSLLISPTQENINTVRFPDSTRGYFGGGNGLLFKTDDGGENFTPLGSGFRPDLTAVTFLDDSFGIAVGGQGAFLSTSNAGGNWSPGVCGTHRWEDVTKAHKDPTSRRLWLAGGTFGDSARIAFSDDDGKTWDPQPIPSPFKLFGIYFTDSLKGFAVGLNGVIYCTQNGGKSWSPKFSNVNTWLLDVTMPTDTTAFVVGGFGTILRTDNFGNTWTPQNSGTQEWLTSVSFIDDSFGIATGNHGVILRTKDSGNNWENVSTSEITFDLTSVSLFRNNDAANKNADAVEVFAVGHNGVILYSPDGGETWEEQDSQTKFQLRDVYFSDSLYGTAVGAYGTILRTDGEDSDTTSVNLDEEINRSNHAPISLGQNYPNPVKTSTTIPFSVHTISRVEITLFDLSGKEIAKLVNRQLPPGNYEYIWNRGNQKSGLFIYQMRVKDYVQTKKMILRE